MGWNNGVLHTPVGIGDLSSALNVASLDLGTIIKNTTTTNIWAKYKGFCHSSPAFSDNATYNAARATRNCGMTMKEYTSLTSAVSDALALSLGSTNWVYDKPTVGQPNEWFRILDYASIDGSHGYDLNAKAPFQMEINPSPAYTLDIPKITDAAGGLTFDNEIQKADLNGNGDAGKTTNYKYCNLNSGVRYGIAFVKNSSIINAATFASMPSNEGLPNNVTSVSSNTTYDVIVFFTDQNFTWDGQQSAGKYYLAPIPRFRWTMRKDSGLWVDATFNSGRTAITLTITNNSGTNRPYTSFGCSASVSGEQTVSTTLATNGTINAGATTQSYTFTKTTGGSWRSNQNFVLTFNATNGKQINETFQAFDQGIGM